MKRFIYFISVLLINLSIITILFIGYVVFNATKELPDYKQLADYNPPVVTRFYAKDGLLLEEYAKEHRLFVPINAIPSQLIGAFLAAEDKNFYTHSGVDISSLVRAFLQNLIYMSQNKKNLVGGSTITQQVVKNFLLSNERSVDRKIKEAILSFRVTKLFSKDRILELYLNQIYLGSGSYGVASAALNYFNKSINELTIEESAFLAALPKAPSAYHPKKNYARAFSRRNWVLQRMYEEHYISKDDFDAAIDKPIKLQTRDITETVKADFFAESVRQNVAQMYGEDMLYSGGLFVRTTLDPQMQLLAEKSFRKGIINYDRRKGFRGPISQIKDMQNWENLLNKIPKDPALINWELAVILGHEKDRILIATESKRGFILNSDMKWVSSNEKNISKILKIGDVIAVESKFSNKENIYELQQIPKVNGGLVVMDPHTGNVLAMVGGYHYANSQFNRATQARRQPGSVFKTFVYLSALENGFTPSSIIEDGPIEMNQGPGLPKWTPKNYHRNYLGPTTLRRGLELSRNTMTVNLAKQLGLNKILEITRRFNINEDPDLNFSIVLGATETTLTKITNAYSIIVNGGKKVSPTLIEKIQDRNGVTIYRNDHSECINCKIDYPYHYEIPQDANDLPEITDIRPNIIDARTAYQTVSILEGVIQHTKTSKAIRELGKTLGGKTGSTNDYYDAWFVGFSPDLVVGTYVGYDEPSSLGNHETGAAVAQPIFTEFMRNYLKDKPDLPFRIPDGIKLVKINYETGKISFANTGTIYEAFKTGTEPKIDQADEGEEEKNSYRKIKQNSKNKNSQLVDGIY